MPSLKLVSLVLALALTTALPASAVAAESGKPNIIFILCDDLGVNDLHCYGRRDHRTPNLDRLAAEGTRFTSAYAAQSICSPSRAAILTAKTPARLHLTTYLPGRANSPAQKLLHPPIAQQVSLDEKTIPDYFKAAGYSTAAIGKWHVGGTGFGPEEHGFDVVSNASPRTEPSATEGSKGEYALTRSAESFFEANRERPFFLYLAHHNPHIPYKALPQHVAKHAGAFEPVYAAVIEALDDVVGRLLTKLDGLRLTDKTIVIFTSDNGGLHVPEGGHDRVTHNTPFRAGKGFLYEGGLRIPLIVRWPSRVPAGRVVDAPVINTDWIPTLLTLAGLPVPAGLDGVDTTPLLTSRGAGPQRAFFWHFPHYNNQGGRPGGAMRDGNWKLVEFYDAPDAPELYDLAADIGEKNNLAARDPARVRAMRTALAGWRNSIQAQSNVPNPDVVTARYRAIYLDTDISRFEPATASAAQWTAVANWRQLMNAAVQPATKAKSAKSAARP
jgi:arylsulfatase A-like enzyme